VTKEAKTAQNLFTFGRFGLLVVLLGRISTGSSKFSSSLPQALPPLPLSTTLYHILALSPLMSSRNLWVPVPLQHWFGKVRCLVVNFLVNYKG